MDKLIYLVRHGQTEANIKNAIQDLSDPLTPKGRGQAAAIADRLRHVSFETLVSSDAERAKDTADLIAKVTGHVPELSPLFREHSPPSSLVGIERSDFRAQAYFKEWNAHVDDPIWHFEDEENYIEFRSRALEALQFLANRAEKTLAVVTQGNLKRALLGVLLFGKDMTFKEWTRIRDSFATSNTAVTVLTYRDGAWRVITWNEIAHMAE